MGEKMVKQFRALLALILIALALSACRGDDPNSPKGVVKQFFSQLQDRNTSGVKNMLCKDFRQNVHFDLSDGQKAKLTFDLDYKTGETTDEMVVIKVYGRIKVFLETDHVRKETRERRREEAPWEIRVAQQDGKWRVCGGDSFILDLLDLTGQVNALEE
jgi:hypothetical protein